MWKQLPKELFEVFGGREMAKSRRNEILISQGKGKVSKEVVKESLIQLVSDDIKKIPDTNNVPAEASNDAPAVEEVGTALAGESEQNTSLTSDFKRKRSQSFDDVKAEDNVEKGDDDSSLKAIKQAQLELEAALEEAEFQSLLLAQNESKEEDEMPAQPAPLLLPSSQILPLLMPPSVPLWGNKKEAIAYRVPAVTWTLLDTK